MPSKATALAFCKTTRALFLESNLRFLEAKNNSRCCAVRAFDRSGLQDFASRHWASESPLNISGSQWHAHACPLANSSSMNENKKEHTVTDSNKSRKNSHKKATPGPGHPSSSETSAPPQPSRGVRSPPHPLGESH